MLLMLIPAYLFIVAATMLAFFATSMRAAILPAHATRHCRLMPLPIDYADADAAIFAYCRRRFFITIAYSHYADTFDAAPRRLYA